MKSLLTLLLTLCLMSVLQAQDGTLDKTFGTGGIVLTPGYEQQGYSAAVQPDDKVVVGGHASENKGDIPVENFLLIRYLRDGAIDSSFGSDGMVTSHYEGFFADAWKAVQVQPDGKILATGDAYDYIKNEYVIVLARHKEDGTPDSSFGSNGSVITDLGGNELANAMTLQPDGKIIVTGNHVDENFNTNLITLRYNIDGFLDKTFNGAGYIIYSLRTGNEAYAAAVQPDGKILIGGVYRFPERFFLLRYLPDGSVDESFGSQGQVITAFEGATEGFLYTQINSLLLLPDNSILAGGIADQGLKTGQSMAVVKYKGDGSLDNSFGEAGKAIVHFKGGNGNSAIFTLLQQADGKLLLTGGANGNGLDQLDFAMARLLPDGRVDSSFGKNGTDVTDLGYIDQCRSAVMQKSGKVVLAGLSYSNDETLFRSFSLARYNTGGEGQPRPIVARIKRFLHNHGIAWNAGGNALYYSLERNSGAGFREVARVQSIAGQRDYTYVIPASSSNSTSASGDSYRVTAVTAGGQRTVSNAVAVGITGAQAAGIYPNPVRNQLSIKGLNDAVTYAATVSDVNGTVYYTSVIRQQAAAALDVSRLKPGSYVLTLGSGAAGMSQTLAFIKN